MQELYEKNSLPIITRRTIIYMRGGVFMERDIDIADMQCWVFRHAQRKWRLTPDACAELFEKYDILGFIAECYGLLHVSSYQCALNDVEGILLRKGVKL